MKYKAPSKTIAIILFNATHVYASKSLLLTASMSCSVILIISWRRAERESNQILKIKRKNQWKITISSDYKRISNLPEHWEFVDNWCWLLGLLAGNGIQMSINSPQSKFIDKSTMRARIIENCFHNQFWSGDNRQQMKIEEKLPSGSLAITVVLRSTPPFLSSVFEKLQFKSSSNNPTSKTKFRGEDYI